MDRRRFPLLLCLLLLAFPANSPAEQGGRSDLACAIRGAGADIERKLWNTALSLEAGKPSPSEVQAACALDQLLAGETWRKGCEAQADLELVDRSLRQTRWNLQGALREIRAALSEGRRQDALFFYERELVPVALELAILLGAAEEAVALMEVSGSN